MIGTGAPWTPPTWSSSLGSTVIERAIGDIRFLYETACDVWVFPPEVAGIYSGWDGVASYAQKTIDPSRTQFFSYTKGITRYVARDGYSLLKLPVGPIIGGDAVSGYFDVKNDFMFDMDLRRLPFPLGPTQKAYFCRLGLYKESTYPYSSYGVEYSRAEKIGPIWRFFVKKSDAEWVLKNRFDKIIWAWVNVQSNMPGITLIAKRLPAGSLAQCVCDSGAIDAMPSPKTGMSDFSLPSMEEVAPNVPAVLTPLDFELFNTSDTNRYNFPCVAVYGRDGLIHLVDTYEAVASLDACEQATMLRIRRALPNGDSITSLGYNLFTTKESISLHNNMKGSYPSIDYSNEICRYGGGFTGPYLDFGTSRLYTGDPYDVVVNIPRGDTEIAYLYFQTSRWVYDAKAYRDVSGDKCYWVNGVYSYDEYDTIPSAPNYFQNVGGTPSTDPPIPIGYFPEAPIGFPDGEQGLDIEYCSLFVTGDSVAYRWNNIDSIFDRETFKNAYAGFIIKCSIPYYSFAYSSVSSIVNEGRDLFRVSWLRSPVVPTASLSKPTPGARTGDAEPCEPCTFVFKSEGRSKIGTLTGRVVCVFNMDPKLGRIEREGADYFYVPLEQGIDWICYVDEDNWIPVSVAVIVVETYLQSNAVRTLFAWVAFYSQRVSRLATFALDTGADLPTTLVRQDNGKPFADGAPHTLYTYYTDYILVGSRYRNYQLVYAPTPVTTVNTPTYSPATRTVSFALSLPPPYRFKVYLGWEAYVGWADTDAFGNPPTKEAYALLEGVEFECDDAGRFELDFSETLYGLPANTTGMKAFVVDPRLGNVVVVDLPVLLPPQTQVVVPGVPAQAASDPASNAPVVLP